MNNKKLLKMYRKCQDCPRCGNHDIRFTVLSHPKKRNKWGIECCYCKLQIKRRMTMRGAIREWNKTTNIVSIADEKIIRKGDV